MVFVIEVCEHFFKVVDMVFENIYIIQFFSNRYSNSIFFSDGADGYNLTQFSSFFSITYTDLPR